MSVHSEAFAKRMAMVGLKPHHRIGKFYPSIVFLFLFYFVDTKKEELKVRKRLQFYSIVVYSFCYSEMLILASSWRIQFYQVHVGDIV